MTTSYLSKMTYFSTLTAAERMAMIFDNTAVMARIKDVVASIEWDHVNAHMVSIFAKRNAHFGKVDLEQETADLTHIAEFVKSVDNIRVGNATWAVRAHTLANNGLEQGWDLLETLNIVERVQFMTAKMEDWATD